MSLAQRLVDNLTLKYISSHSFRKVIFILMKLPLSFKIYSIFTRKVGRVAFPLVVYNGK